MDHSTNELFTSRPDCQERLEKEVQCYNFLEENQIPFTGIDHPAAMTVDDCHDADKKTRHSYMQKSLFMQPSENKFLSAFDAWQETLQDQAAFFSDPHCAAFFCLAGIYGRTFKPDPWFCHHHGLDV